MHEGSSLLVDEYLLHPSSTRWFDPLSREAIKGSAETLTVHRCLDYGFQHG